MHYVYRPDQEPLLVDGTQYQKYLNDGWYDTPAKFMSSEEKPVSEVVDVKKKRGRPPKNPALN